MGKLYTKEKTRAEQERDEQRMDDMITFWMSYVDHKWNPWFLPLDGGWYTTNWKCELTAEQFNASFRAYISK